LGLSGEGDHSSGQERSSNFQNVADAHGNTSPVSESQVASEAERVVRSFMINAHRHYQLSQEEECVDGTSHSPYLVLATPPIPELESPDEDFLIAEDGASPLRFGDFIPAELYAFVVYSNFQQNQIDQSNSKFVCF
jgi:hypothetical protein